MLEIKNPNRNIKQYTKILYSNKTGNMWDRKKIIPKNKKLIQRQ